MTVQFCTILIQKNDRVQFCTILNWATCQMSNKKPSNSTFDLVYLHLIFKAILHIYIHRRASVVSSVPIFLALSTLFSELQPFLASFNTKLFLITKTTATTAKYQAWKQFKLQAKYSPLQHLHLSARKE